jgi:hypothetical protein
LRGVKRVDPEVGQRHVVGERADPADEEIAILGDVEVKYGLNTVLVDDGDPGDPADGSERVARFQVAGLDPAPAGRPETVEGAADDRLAFDVDPEGRARRVVVDVHHGLITERSGAGDILSQHEVADLK